LGISYIVQFETIKGKSSGITLSYCFNYAKIELIKRDTQDLGSIVHEINELEVSMLLKEIGGMILGESTIELTDEIKELLEYKEKLNYIKGSLSHLISPYGDNCLIGWKKLKW